MRAIVITFLALSLWVFLAWVGICTCTWLENIQISVYAFTVVSALVCIISAALAGIVWLACVSEEDDSARASGAIL